MITSPLLVFGPHRQRGVTTLAITLLLLFIVTVIVLFSTTLAFFEQRTTNNENRAKLAEQAAEYSLNVASEFFKANTGEIVGTWLATGTSRWQSCTVAVATGQTDPCLAEGNVLRRAELYRYSFSGSTKVDFEPVVAAAGRLSTVGGTTAQFPVTTNVTAVLCRIDMADPANPACRQNPSSPGQFAVTLVSDANMDGENARAQVKHSVATYRTFGGATTPPLVASGTLTGLGSSTIVTDPNSGGFGLPVSIWSACQVDIDKSPGVPVGPGCTAPGSGNASVATCYVEDFLDGNSLATLETSAGCARTGSPCKCDDPISAGGSVKQEGIDILDVDGNRGSPDSEFFPRQPFDDDGNALDDSMFEFLFGVDVENEVLKPATAIAGTRQTCTTTDPLLTGNAALASDCAMAALEGIGAKIVASCTGLSAATSGLVLVTGNCDLPDMGTLANPVVLVVAGNVSISGNGNFYGIIFNYSRNNTASFSGSGGMNFFGSVIVQGSMDLGGGPAFVYSEKVAESIRNSAAFQRFAKVPGSWLDSRAAF